MFIHYFNYFHTNYIIYFDTPYSNRSAIYRCTLRSCIRIYTATVFKFLDSICNQSNLKDQKWYCFTKIKEIFIGYVHNNRYYVYVLFNSVCDGKCFFHLYSHPFDYCSLCNKYVLNEQC